MFNANTKIKSNNDHTLTAMLILSLPLSPFRSSYQSYSNWSIRTTYLPPTCPFISLIPPNLGYSSDISYYQQSIQSIYPPLPQKPAMLPVLWI